VRSGAAEPRIFGNWINRPTPQALIVQLERYLEQNPHQRPSLSEVGAILGFERTYCSRIFRSVTGVSFMQWDRNIRIRIAKALLQSTTAPISAIGFAVGYCELTTFERNFRRSEGMSPTQFRSAFSNVQDESAIV
jgi:AraC-like DNA-binding protein